MVNFRKFLLPNKPVIFLKIFREIYVCPNHVWRQELHAALSSGHFWQVRGQVGASRLRVSERVRAYARVRARATNERTNDTPKPCRAPFVRRPPMKLGSAAGR